MRVIYLLIIALLAASCSSNSIWPKAGTWRATVEIQGQQLPFNLIIKEDSTGGIDAYIKNDEEKILLDEISFVNDSIEMVLHIFDAKLKAKVNGDSLTGLFVLNYADNYRLPFRAANGQDYRFSKTNKSSVATDFSGKYAVQFFNKNDTTQSVGIFFQEGDYVKGTFLMTTGDYRFLEGSVINDELWLSTFDGNHAYLFKAKKENDSTLLGEHWSGKTLHRPWRGIKNPSAAIADPETVTYLKEGYEKISFSFPDVNGNTVSLTDEKFRDKVVILQILGTWCPNCMDETKFLAPWYKKNKNRGVEILGLAYERKPDFEYARERVVKMKNKLNVGYDIVIAGVNDNKKALETLPMLNKFTGWPMTIFVGKDGKVKHIHTGFTGPGTGTYYIEQIQRFNQIVNELLNEDVVTLIK